MRQIGGPGRCFVLFLALVVAAPPAVLGAQEDQEDQEALLVRLRELMEQHGSTRFLTPMPGSRSNVMAVDASTTMYFYLERGSIRGSAIDDFYAAYDSGDRDAAYEAFLGSAIMILRITDYGWNGLGNPMVTESGSRISDIVFKDVGGVFSRASEITEEDVSDFMGLLRTAIAALEGSE